MYNALFIAIPRGVWVNQGPGIFCFYANKVAVVIC